ncbi:MAG TPA: SPOR domain-containing protein, partial [Pararobbsia sp.]|nr:SPOR domain-containing protein [Pararobbsia sp.]
MATKRRTSSKQGGAPSKQGGGTFVGIVLGLIVGLAIAVIVALYITRSPTPFVAKLTGGNGASDASAASDVDLNRSLQGKSPGQAVQAPAQPQGANPATSANNGANLEPQIIEVPSSAPQAQAPAVVPGTGGTAAQNSATPQAPAAQTGKPAQSAANAPAAQQPAPAAQPAPSANDANSGYLLQVGAYKTENDAEQQRARLAFQGFESKVTRRDAAGVTYFRVRVGPFTKFAD